MKKALAVACCLLLFFVAIVRADTMQTEQNINFNFSSGESFSFQDLENNVTVTFTVASGSLTGLGNVSMSATGGTLVVQPDANGTLSVASSRSGVYFYVDNEPYSGPFDVAGGFTVSWQFEEDVGSSVVYAVVGSLTVGLVAVLLVVMWRRNNTV